MRPPSERVLLLSLKPTYADAILDGRKTVELRRVRPRALPGTTVLIYASTPRRALLGGCEVVGVRTGEPDEVWDLHGPLTSVDRPTYDAYFEGASTAVAIQVGNPWRLLNPIPLEALRLLGSEFEPPQSFRYVPKSACRSILRRATLPQPRSA